jgi:alpha-beta hydrolase superfamily lysophospholipase
MRERTLTFSDEPGVRIAGTLCLPEDASMSSPAPAMVLFGGTFGDTRDGDMALPRTPYAVDAPKSGLLRRIAHALAAKGVGSLRFDKRGCGESVGPLDPGSDLRDATAALRTLQGRPEVDPRRVGAAGHSAGASHVCAIARETSELACAGLLGMLYGSSEDLVRWNWGRLARFWPRFSNEQRAWLRTHRQRDVVAAFRADDFLAAAERGDDFVRLEAEGVSHEFELVRFRHGMQRLREHPRIEQLREVRCPVLLLHGAEDLNVRVEDALDSFRAFRETGHERVELAIIPGVDHNYQPVPDDPVARAWERVSFESQARPVSTRALDVLASWAARVLASPADDGANRADAGAIA